MILLPALVAGVLANASLVDDVRNRAAHGDFAAAEQEVRAYQAQNGTNAELAAALSWLARGGLAHIVRQGSDGEKRGERKRSQRHSRELTNCASRGSLQSAPSGIFNCTLPCASMM